jgi:hypothetical protein
MSPEGFETTMPANKRPQTYALDRTATGIGKGLLVYEKLLFLISVDVIASFRIASL